MADTRTVVVADADCWSTDCRWHATGTEWARVEMAAIAHEHDAHSDAFPLTGPVERIVDFHSCRAFNKDRPATSGCPCTTTDEDAA